MIEVVPAQTGDALEHVIALSLEYVNWMVAEIRVHYPDLDISEFTSAHAYDDVREKFPGDHVPPHGCLLIAVNNGDVCGCIALGRLTASTAEMRTLYVRPGCRGMGVGKRLVEASLAKAREFGYGCVRLDTLAFMDSALGLYKSVGFYEIGPYRDVSDSLKAHIRFLEIKLA